MDAKHVLAAHAGVVTERRRVQRSCTPYNTYVKANHMNKVVVTLDERDLLELQAVLLDGDAAGALEFLRTRVAPKIPTKGTARCDSSRLNPYLRKPDTADGRP